MYICTASIIMNIMSMSKGECLPMHMHCKHYHEQQEHVLRRMPAYVYMHCEHYHEQQEHELRRMSAYA